MESFVYYLKRKLLIWSDIWLIIAYQTLTHIMTYGIKNNLSKFAPIQNPNSKR